MPEVGSNSSDLRKTRTLDPFGVVAIRYIRRFSDNGGLHGGAFNMESSLITRPGFYWYFDPTYGRAPPKIVEVLFANGAFFARYEGKDDLTPIATMPGDFAGPFPLGGPTAFRGPQFMRSAWSIC
jgi:hypothetical protein